ncbi:hypothetical protein EDB89DRAFT_1912578 [Lactarius sanguifluus]|nr:hypothetical protein EDB89DRAFT_1912578 [Lactarius sanguifluus]
MYIPCATAAPICPPPPPLPTSTVLPSPWSLSVVVGAQLLLLSVIIIILSRPVALLPGLAAPDIVHRVAVGLAVAMSLRCGGGGGNLRDLRGDTWGYASHGQRREVLGSCGVLGWQETWDLHGGVFYGWRWSQWACMGQVEAAGSLQGFKDELCNSDSERMKRNKKRKEKHILMQGVAAADVGVRHVGMASWQETQDLRGGLPHGKGWWSQWACMGRMEAAGGLRGFKDDAVMLCNSDSERMK